jgi:polyphosphate kinase
MKMNSLLDASAIRALYRASQAGVCIEINVRGICALRPGVPGVSENITVTSVVNRFLEHSRIYSFERHSEPESIYIGSADLMPRNLYNRVELVTPILDDKARAELVDVLDRSLADNTTSWELGEDGSWRRRLPGGEESRNVQQELIERHVERAATGAAVETAIGSS